MSKNNYYFEGFLGNESSFPFFVALDHLTTPIPPHRHDYLEITLVISGFGKEIINGIEHNLAPGTFTFMTPWYIHEIIPDTNHPLELYKCNFGVNMLVEDQQYEELNHLVFDNLYETPYIDISTTDTAKIKAIYEIMLDELNHVHLWKDLFFKTKIIELLIHFDRFRNNKNREMPSPEAPNTDTNIWNIIHFIHAHFREDLTLSRIAKKFHFNESYLSGAIKKHTGQNFTDLLHEIRVRNACALITSFDMSITEISHAVGYRSPKTFFRVFKSIKGISPDQFRKNDLTQYQPNPSNVITMPSCSGLVWRIIYHMHLYYMDELTLRKTAAHFHFSESHINEYLKRYTGQSFNDLLHEIRIWNACILFSTTTMSTTDIAYQVGYNSYKTFYRTFSNAKNMSPEAFRKHTEKDE
ncbi:AraC family transcriptional regulator [Salipaludibacillus sp. HK11]|uniref:AraC family transcriptional regulator n=1 Tax=Salipaludibacillus sp. HK11 TaxID=3394320 RepID=UPI0039FD8DB9